MAGAILVLIIIFYTSFPQSDECLHHSKDLHDQYQHDYVTREADLKFRTGKAEFSNQTRSPIMIAPAYATAHMSQILIEPEERAQLF